MPGDALYADADPSLPVGGAPATSAGVFLSNGRNAAPANEKPAGARRAPAASDRVTRARSDAVTSCCSLVIAAVRSAQGVMSGAGVLEGDDGRQQRVAAHVVVIAMGERLRLAYTTFRLHGRR